MKVSVIPMTDFVHGNIHAFEGVPMEIEQTHAVDLEAAGLLRIKMAPQHDNKMMPAPDNKAGKAPAAGEVPPSSVSPAAQASASTTLHSPGPGKGKPLKLGT